MYDNNIFTNASCELEFKHFVQKYFYILKCMVDKHWINIVSNKISNFEFTRHVSSNNFKNVYLKKKSVADIYFKTIFSN